MFDSQCISCYVSQKFNNVLEIGLYFPFDAGISTVLKLTDDLETEGFD